MTVFDDILEMRIAPRRDGNNWTVRDWLAVDFSTEEGWHQAIDIFEDRIRRRLLEVVAGIEDYLYSGFAVLALDCLLIETLQQFREGVSETPSHQGRTYFKRFLTQTSFRQHFDDETAGMFYAQIGNGILHQAEVKSTSRIGIWPTELVSLTPDDQGLIINRCLFHQQLVNEFEQYLEELRNPANEELRAKFKHKMDHICRVKEITGGENG